MGHYASEMDPNWGKEDKRETALKKKGYLVVSRTDLITAGCPLDHFIGCERCGALVFDTKKHSKVCA